MCCSSEANGTSYAETGNALPHRNQLAIDGFRRWPFVEQALQFLNGASPI
jgi:hypothetical protein